MKNRYQYIILFSLHLFLGVTQGYAQQEPLFSQYRLNAFVVNPAIAGSQSHHEIRLGTRMQWQSFPGAPRTYTLSYHGRTDDNSGIGGVLFSDVVGPTVRNGLQIAYAYRMPVGQPGTAGQNTLSLGFSGKIIQYGFHAERVSFQTAGDPAASEAAQGISVADAAFGAYWQNDRFYAGFSVPNLIQTEFGAYVPNQSQRSLISQLARHYFFMTGYRISYDNMSIEPSVLVRKTQATPYQIEGTMKLYLKEDHLILGLGYRTEWLATTFVAVQNDNWIVAYSADFMVPQRRATQVTYGPSHEIMLGLDLGKKWNQMFRGEDY